MPIADHFVQCAEEVKRCVRVHFFKMKGDIGMAQNTKKERTRGHHTAKTHQATYMAPSILSLPGRMSLEQRYRDGAM